MIPSHNKHERYSTISAQKSEGEVGATDEDISLGEIRVPGQTIVNKKSSGMPTINISAQLRQPSNTRTNYARPLAETINYEEDKVSPEKDDEKPLYESSEGPIQKTRTTFPGRSVVSGTKQPPKNNVVSSFDSFGMSGNLVKRSMGLPSGGGYKRGTIQDDFLEQHDEDDESSLRQSAESGEIRDSAFPPTRK